MTPTSIERFRRALAGLVVSLIVLCAVFVVLGYLQGPKLTDAQVDADAVTKQSGQQLRLFANQAVADVADAQVTVTPDASTSVTTNGDVIAVQFDEPLHYATHYTVRVTDVRSLDLPQPATLEYSFTTTSPELYYLDRGSPDDVIVRTGLTGIERTVVFTGQRIQEFAVVGQALVVLSLDSAGVTQLQLVSLSDGEVETLVPPGEGTVSDIGTSSVGSFLGFVFTPADASTQALGGRELFVVNLDAGRALTAVAGLDGTPLVVADWHFIPGGSTLVAQSVEQTMFVVDAATPGIPAPLGQFAELTSISADGATMAVRDAQGSLLVDLTSGTATRVTPSLIQGGHPYVGAIEPLAGGDLVEKVALQTTTGKFVVVIALDDGAAGRVVYEPVTDSGSIGSFSVSPNGQYVAIEVVPDVTSAVADGYPDQPRTTSVTTVVVDVQSGQVVRTLDGFALVW